MTRACTRVAMLALVVFAAVAPSAHAGGYDVYACDAGVAGGANNSFAAIANGGMTAYTWCPPGQGLVARNVYDNGQTGFLEGAWMIFDAPPGTYVESISFEGGVRRHSCSYTTAVIASDFDLGGRIVWGYPANQQCDGWYTADENSFFPTRFNLLVNAPRVRLESRCGAASCPRNGVAGIHIKNVTVHVRDDTPPGLSNGRGSLWTSNGWLSGRQSVGFDASDGAGVREASIAIDGREVTRQIYACDYTRRSPCGSASVEEAFGTAGFGGDGDHTVTLAAVDGGGNRAAASRTVHIDNSPPDAPQNLVIDGGDGWRSGNDFNVRWNVVAPKVGAHVAGAEWDLCAANSSKCTHGSQDGRDLAAIQHLKVPAPGEYSLRLWLRDEAGNQDPRLAPPPLKLRYDDASPDVSLDPIDAEDPTLVTATTSDRGSGVSSGQIQIRRKGRQQWTDLSTTVQGARLVARIDDEHLGDGVYELQARAADQAGNERATTLRSDGSEATLTLPLRLKTRLRAGVERKHGRRSRLARSAFVPYGRLVRVRGRLSSPEGNPLQEVEVQAYTQVRGSGMPARLIATVRTGRSGRFSFVVRRGPSRTIRIRYGGTGQIRSATKVVLLNVRSRTSIRPSRRRLVNGETVRFRGRIATGRIPALGKLVELQVWIRGRWRTFATTRAGRRGAWHYDYRFDGTRGHQSYRFRARVPPETSYPFATGRSRVVRVEVIGL